MTEHGASNEAGSGPSEPDTSTKHAREAAWDDVATHFSRLGQQVRERFEHPADEPADEPTDTPETSTETPSTRATPSGDTVRRWIDKLDETFTKLGDTVRDPAFRQEAGASVGRLGEALGMTLREAGEQMQGRFGRTRSESAPDAPTPPAADVTPPPAPAPPEPTTTPPDDADAGTSDEQAPPA